MPLPSLHLCPQDADPEPDPAETRARRRRWRGGVALGGVVVAGVVSAAAVLVFVGGGYWENTPPFDRLSGPVNFAQRVADPIPPSILDLRGGYEGFPNGGVSTLFRYAGPFDDNLFLKDWNEIPVELVRALYWQMPASRHIAASKGYRKGDGDWYLLVDEQSRTGMLFYPGR